MFNAPTRVIFLPCTCSATADQLTIALDCTDPSLNDTQVADIFDYFLSASVNVNESLGGISPLNLLTVVPSVIQFFDQLTFVSLSQNVITRVDSGAFCHKLGLISISVAID